MLRIDGRGPEQIRDLKITPHFMPNAEGSCLIEMGKTKVICTATVENRVPPHVYGTGNGWVTAEYEMMPRCSSQRIQRDRNRGKINGRSQEIQRLIGRAMRAIFDMNRFGERQVILDCDVLQADGGTRCASITGAFVALALAMEKLRETGKMQIQPLKDYVAALSVGVVEGVPVADLCYLEDSQAEVDMNVVLTGSGKFVEIQGTAEAEPFDADSLARMQVLARGGIEQLIAAQREIVPLEFPDEEGG